MEKRDFFSSRLKKFSRLRSIVKRLHPRAQLGPCLGDPGISCGLFSFLSLPRHCRGAVTDPILSGGLDLQRDIRREFNQPAHTQLRDSQLFALRASEAEDWQHVSCFCWPSKNSLSQHNRWCSWLKTYKQGCGDFSSLIGLLYRALISPSPLNCQMGSQPKCIMGCLFLFFLPLLLPNLPLLLILRSIN